MADVEETTWGPCRLEPVRPGVFPAWKVYVGPGLDVHAGFITRRSGGEWRAGLVRQTPSDARTFTRRSDALDFVVGAGLYAIGHHPNQK